jgi:hypothetical protein
MAQKRPATSTSGPGGDAISIQDCSPGWSQGACQVIKQLQKLLGGFHIGKQNIYINVKYAMCVTSGLKIATKNAFSDAPHSWLSIDTLIQELWGQNFFDHFSKMTHMALHDANAILWHFRCKSEKIPL